MKIALFVPNLSLGGCQRMAVQLAAGWAGSGHQVTLVIVNKSPVFYDAPATVRIIKLELQPMHTLKIRRKYRLIPRMHGLHKAFSSLDADVVIVMGADVWAQIALWPGRRATPAIMAMRTDPQTYPDALSWNGLSRLAEPKADAIVVMTEAARQFYLRRADVPIHVIPNMVHPNTRAFVQRDDGQRIISHGRLHSIKGLDVLIQAFARVNAALPQSHLLLVGDGPERAKLGQLIASLGLQHAVSMPGSTHQIDKALALSDVYVMPSLSEAFGNALVEAMAAGLPVIATDCDGPMSIIRSGENGLIVPRRSVDALADAMKQLLTDEALRRRLAQRALATVEQYHPERIMPLWDAAMDSAIQRFRTRHAS